MDLSSIYSFDVFSMKYGFMKYKLQFTEVQNSIINSQRNSRWNGIKKLCPLMVS